MLIKELAKSWLVVGTDLGDTSIDFRKSTSSVTALFQHSSVISYSPLLCLEDWLYSTCMDVFCCIKINCKLIFCSPVCESHF